MEIVEVNQEYYLVIERAYDLYYCKFSSVYCLDRHNDDEVREEISEAYYKAINTKT